MLSLRDYSSCVNNCEDLLFSLKSNGYFLACEQSLFGVAELGGGMGYPLRCELVAINCLSLRSQFLYAYDALPRWWSDATIRRSSGKNSTFSFQIFWWLDTTTTVHRSRLTLPLLRELCSVDAPTGEEATFSLGVVLVWFGFHTSVFASPA